MIDSHHQRKPGSPLCLGVIPARYASTRFPGKPLALIAGKPMAQRVYEQASKAHLLHDTLVATDDDRIRQAVEGFGGRVMMTSPEHTCGTDRLAEVARGRPEYNILVNIQGDEPLIAPEAIDLAVKKLLEEPGAGMSTLAAPCLPEDFDAPDVVKVVMDSHGFALYFSRAAIPYRRNQSPGAGPWRHIGLYAYRRSFLLEFAAAPSTPLEKMESLEQLRALEMGRRIACAISPYPSIGVDTPEDVVKVEKEMAARSWK